MLDETYEVDGNTYQLYRFATIVPVGEGVVSRGRRDHDVGHWEACYGWGHLGQCGSGGPDRIKSGRRDAES